MQEITFERLRETFRKSGQKRVEIVYDVDDVLWKLMYRVASRLGVDYERSSAIFRMCDNPDLTDSEREAIFAAFGDPTMFEDIEFLPGAEDILRPQELGAVVKIKSNSFNQRIAELKSEQLLKCIPGLTPGDMILHVIDSSATYQKKLDNTMTILVEDSPCNVSLSGALLNVMPSHIAWSTGPEALDIIKDKPVVWKNSLAEMNDYIYEATRAILKGA